MIKHRSDKPFTDRHDYYQEVTDKIIAALENGTRPWRQPWRNGSPGMPINATTGRPYHGINVLLLAMTSFALGGDPRFCSYKQASDRGWQVRKGERGTIVFFLKRMLVEDHDAAPDDEDRTKAIPMLRAYTVFNAAIGSTSCCWPIGDPGTPSFRFCNAPNKAGKPYCPEHCVTAYRGRKGDEAPA
jgi:antirestriction protein ArdC